LKAAFGENRNPKEGDLKELPKSLNTDIKRIRASTPLSTSLKVLKGLLNSAGSTRNVGRNKMRRETQTSWLSLKAVYNNWKRTSKASWKLSKRF